MTTTAASDFITACRRALNDYLREWLARPCPAPVLAEAMRYSVLGDGKRIRPALVCAAAELGARGIDDVLPAAAAVELIHGYSLIHDDLPAMDNDDMRRGMPACHVAFGEAQAILAGDALQAAAFQMLAEEPIEGVGPTERLEMVRILAQAAGSQGMAGGQMLDISRTDAPVDRDHLMVVHNSKTGALFRASVQLGALAANLGAGERRSLSEYGRAIGLAFQIADDILDAGERTPDAGADKEKAVNYTQLHGGHSAARREVQRLTDSALSALCSFGDEAQRLRDLARHMAGRRN